MANNVGILHTSANGGVTWTDRQPAEEGTEGWSVVASDSDGSHLIAGIGGGRLYTATPNPYDFTNPYMKLELQKSGFIDAGLGYFYSAGDFDNIPITRQKFTESKISKDDKYLTVQGESFTTWLDTNIFYGGRYDGGGIAASTLFAEVLDDVDFPAEGDWGYVIGDAGCVASDTTLIWERTGYDYYHIDSAFDTVMVDIPIPPVTHRKALTMLAAYCGAHLLHRSDGSLDIVPDLGSALDYHLDIDRIYDRPETIKGENVTTIQGKLRTYNTAVGSTTIMEAAIEAVTTDQTTFTITHDPCSGGSLELTDATLNGSPTYNTYSTTFDATPDFVGTFTLVLSGNAVTFGESQLSKTYDTVRGETKDFDNPIASDRTMALAMYDRYHTFKTAMSYKFSMRDDPAIEVGDRVKLDTLAVPDGIPVIVTAIRRKFNGATDGEYTVVEDPY
ncbi:MAG: hypothetical protein JRC93_04015 [Deltaproteobacteria bacterium]|nr:hypothetical protein [Deltaproteobacteria bacterium]